MLGSAGFWVDGVESIIRPAELQRHCGAPLPGSSSAAGRLPQPPPGVLLGPVPFLPRQHRSKAVNHVAHGVSDRRSFNWSGWDRRLGSAESLSGWPPGQIAAAYGRRASAPNQELQQTAATGRFSEFSVSPAAAAGELVRSANVDTELSAARHRRKDVGG